VTAPTKPRPAQQTDTEATDQAESAAEGHTGGMVALVPADEYLGQLAIDGGDPVEQLHLTLAYLGDDVTEWTPEDRDQLINQMLAVAQGVEPVEARAFAPSLFNPDGGADGDRDPCLVLLIGDSSELTDIRDQVIRGVQAAGIDLPEQHAPFVPHVTVSSGNMLNYGITAGYVIG
jgi:2'-5' RNA ligase